MLCDINCMCVILLQGHWLLVICFMMHMDQRVWPERLSAPVLARLKLSLSPSEGMVLQRCHFISVKTKINIYLDFLSLIFFRPLSFLISLSLLPSLPLSFSDLLHQRLLDVVLCLSLVLAMALFV